MEPEIDESDDFMNGFAFAFILIVLLIVAICLAF